MKYLRGVVFLVLPLSSALAFEAKGEIHARYRMAQYDDNTVRLEGRELVRQADGKTWKGLGMPWFTVDGSHISAGAGFNLSYRVQGDWLIVEGYRRGKAYRLDWPADPAVAQKSPYIALKGEAAERRSPSPQFVLALLGAVNAY